MVLLGKITRFEVNISHQSNQGTGSGFRVQGSEFKVLWLQTVHRRLLMIFLKGQDK